MKVCPDCKVLYRPGPGCRRGRCADCERQHDRARGSSAARGYGGQHQAERARWAPLVATGNVKCWRCAEFIPADASWDLGHKDDRSGYAGPECLRCNRATSGRK